MLGAADFSARMKNFASPLFTRVFGCAVLAAGVSSQIARALKVAQQSNQNDNGDRNAQHQQQN